MVNKKHNTTGLRVALVSYDPRQLRVWSRYLEEQSTGLRCRGFRSGEALLLRLREKEAFDVVVLGGQMEDMDARTLLERAGKLSSKPFFLLMDDALHEKAAADSLDMDGPCYLVRQTSLRDLLERLQSVPDNPSHRVEKICKGYYSQWGIVQPDINCTYLTQAVSIACTSESKMAIRKEILQQVAEQHGMKTIAVDSGLRRLVDGLELRQPESWKRFKRQNHLDDTKVTTGKLIYALKAAVEKGERH